MKRKDGQTFVIQPERKADSPLDVEGVNTLALAEKVSALMTENYLGKRAKRGSRSRFEQAMDKVADVEPEEYDRL